MEQHVLTLLKNISLNDVKVFNGNLFTCKDGDTDMTPCLTCMSCQMMIVINFCGSILNHMTDQNIVDFIHDCIGPDLINDVVEVLECLLSPLNGKDRIYSRSRARPSLCTDLTDLGLKNPTVSKEHIHKTTKTISTWIVQQPNTFKLQFLVSILSRLKLVVLENVQRSIDLRGKLRTRDGSYEPTFGQFINNKMVDGDGFKILGIGLVQMNKDSNLSKFEETSFNTSVDFISMLPVHISKYILNLLDEQSLKVCSGISDNWKTIVSQVRREDVVNQKIKEQSMLLQEVSSKPIDANYAKDIDVQVPMLKPGTIQVVYRDGFEEKPQKKQRRLSLENSIEESPIPVSREIFNMSIGYKNIKTKNVIMEERNVYCGAYSVLLVKEGIPKQIPPAIRTIAYNSGNLIAVSGSSKVIEFLDVEGRKTNLAKTKIRGHAGSIKVLKIMKKKGNSTLHVGFRSINENQNDGEVLSGSYDTTIRRWDIRSGKCAKIYIGHTLTVTALDVGEDIFASGSMDGTCKLWNFDDGSSILTMKHYYPVSAVAISNKLCVTGDSSGMIKVWNIKNGALIKNLLGHSKEISAVRVDSFHILSSSLDCYVLLWSAIGDFATCIGCFRHPKPVLCMEIAYLRAITGSSDGRIRIWDILTGQCIRIIRGNSRSDPIITMVVNENRVIINTVSNILVLNFETVEWVYADDKETNHKKVSMRIHNDHPDGKSASHSYQRFERARLAGNIDPRIFISPMTKKNERLQTHTTKEPHKDQTVRQFEDGMQLNRATAWLVTPSLTKSLRLNEKTPNLSSKSLPTNETSLENDQVVDRSEEGTRAITNSSPERRISYGFERQDHLQSDIKLHEMKSTLRKHIRSRPTTAVEAMPDFVKTMILQMRDSSSTGRPISAFASVNIPRRSSEPKDIDCKSKVSAEEIKKSLNLITQDQPNISQQFSTISKLSKKQISQSTSKENVPKSNILSSAKNSSNRSIVDFFFVPKDYKQILSEKKIEFDKRHQIHPTGVVGNEKYEQRNVLTVTNLHLKTYQDSQLYLEQVNKISSDYEQSKVLSEQSERHQNWLRKATNLTCPAYEKDVIMKRPRSAKI